MRSDVRILVIDDEEDHARAMAECLEKVGYQCIAATEGKEGLRVIKRGAIDVVVTDLVMKDVDGMEVLEAVRERLPDAQVIFITGHGTVEAAVAAMQKGATTFIQKPINIHQLRVEVDEAVRKQVLMRSNPQRVTQVEEGCGSQGIIGNSTKMQRIFSITRQIAPTSATALIIGESGTGKELIARAIHYNSPRKAQPFVVINSAAIPEGLLESELFGHERGAFTGAFSQRKGKFEYAHRGTLFLDEIGDMPLSTQAKLLRVIEDGKVVRVGSNEPFSVDVRIIAATNQDLEALIREGRFREDLYFRLNVVCLKLPPLRERQEDKSLLIDAFVKEYSRVYGKKITSITPEARRRLLNYSWPGNVRELKNCIESMVVLTSDSTIGVEDIPGHIALEEGQEEKGALVGMSIAEMEKELIKNTLAAVGGHRAASAKILGIGERSLYRKLDQYGLK
jgi:two-component system response regulator HydG